MKKTTYSCDLCNEEQTIDGVAAYKLVGSCPNHPDTSKKKLELSDAEIDIKKSDNHICFACTQRIIEFRKSIATD